MARYLLDTTVLIDYLRGRTPVTALLASLAEERHELGVCAVNVAELYSRLEPGDTTRAEDLLQNLVYYSISRADAKQAGRHRYDFARRGKTLTVTDTLIAAVAIARGCTLVTANRKDYPMTEIQLLEQP